MPRLYILLLALFCNSIVAQDYIRTKQCRFSNFELSDSGKYVSFFTQKGDIDKLGDRGFSHSVYDLKNKKIIYNSKGSVVNFKWALGSDYFYMTQPKMKKILQWSVLDGHLGTLSNALHDPYNISVLGAGGEGVDFFAESIVIDSIKANLGYIPVINYTTKLPIELRYRKGGKFYNRKYQAAPLSKEIRLNVEGTYRWWVDPNGKPYARIAINQSNSSYSIISVDSKSNKDKKVLLIGDLKGLSPSILGPYANDFFPVYDQNNERFKKLYSISNFETDTVSLYENDIKTLKPIKQIYVNTQFDVNKPIIGLSGELLGIEIYTRTREFIPLSENGRKLGKIIDKLSKGIFKPFDVTVAGSTGDNDSIIVNFSSLGFNQVYHIALASSLVTPVPQECTQATNRKTVILNDSKPMGYLTYNPASIDKPLVILLHGGPRIRDRLLGEDYLYQYFDKNDYPILRVNYTGSIGFGVSFSDLSDVKNSGQNLKDIEHLLKLVPEHVSSNNRKVIVGGSFGGYLVLKSLFDKHLFNKIDHYIAINAPLSFQSLDSSFGDNSFGYFSKMIEPKILSLAEIKIEKTNIPKQGLLVWGRDDQIVKPDLEGNKLLVKKFEWFKTIELENSGHSISSSDLGRLYTELDVFFESLGHK